MQQHSDWRSLLKEHKLHMKVCKEAQFYRTFTYLREAHVAVSAFAGLENDAGYLTKVCMVFLLVIH